MPIKVRDLIRMVEQDGWKLVRVTGSHRHYRHPDKSGTVTIPGHPSDVLAIGTEKSVLKQAGLERK
jgi:predicted RNA binding protein YcfA (HicA-like mRNA interferase family)